METKGLFQFKIFMTVSVSYFRCILIPMSYFLIFLVRESTILTSERGPRAERGNENMCLTYLIQLYVLTEIQLLELQARAQSLKSQLMRLKEERGSFKITATGDKYVYVFTV